MSYLFAFPASRELHEDFVTVEKAYGQGSIPRESQAPLFVKMTQRYSDEIVAAMILNLAQGGSGGDANTSKVLETVASLIKSTVHALIRQVIGKLSNEDLAPVAAYVASRRTQLDQNGKSIDYISFELTPADYQLLYKAWSAAASGVVDKPAMTAAMLRFSELAVRAFYEESAQAVKLGFIARNMFSVGNVAISKGSKTAISRLIPSLRDRDLKDFAAYFLSMLQSI